MPVGETFYSPGRLGTPLNITSEGATDYVVYTAPLDVDYVIANVSITNRDTAILYSACVAISTSSSPGDHEFIEWGTKVAPSGTLEVTKLMLAPGEKIIVRFPGLPAPVNLVVNGTFASPGGPGAPYYSPPTGWYVFGSNYDASSGYLEIGGSVTAVTSPSYSAVPGATYTYSFTVPSGSGSFYDGSPKFSIAWRPSSGGAWMATPISITGPGTYTGQWTAPSTAYEIQLQFGTYSYTGCRIDNVVFYKNVVV